MIIAWLEVELEDKISSRAQTWRGIGLNAELLKLRERRVGAFYSHCWLLVSLDPKQWSDGQDLVILPGFGRSVLCLHLERGTGGQTDQTSWGHLAGLESVLPYNFHRREFPIYYRCCPSPLSELQISTNVDLIRVLLTSFHISVKRIVVQTWVKMQSAPKT